MTLSAKQLSTELAKIIDPSIAEAIIDSYTEMQQRFFAGDWQPSELDGGRLCEAIARAIYEFDSGTVTHSQLPNELCEKLGDEQNLRTHKLDVKARRHIARCIMLVYTFRSDRGSVHNSPEYTANEMASILMIHAGKWIITEFLRLT